LKIILLYIGIFKELTETPMLMLLEVVFSCFAWLPIPKRTTQLRYFKEYIHLKNSVVEGNFFSIIDQSQIELQSTFYHGIFSACCSFSTVRHRRGIASGGTPFKYWL
jgi:hypothetical protein